HPQLRGAGKLAAASVAHVDAFGVLDAEPLADEVVENRCRLPDADLARVDLRVEEPGERRLRPELRYPFAALGHQAELETAPPQRCERLLCVWARLELLAHVAAAEREELGEAPLVEHVPRPGAELLERGDERAGAAELVGLEPESRERLALDADQVGELVLHRRPRRLRGLVDQGPVQVEDDCPRSHSARMPPRRASRLFL